MGFIDSLYDRFVTAPVAKRITKSLKSNQPNIFSVPIGFNSAMATYNKRITSNSVDWNTLRSLSINSETTRAAINARKRQITQLSYDVVDVDDDTNPQTTFEQRQQARDVMTHLGGDGVRFRAILDRLIEDTMVLDACVFYKQRDRAGRLLKIIPIDGGTIKLRVDSTGGRPQPPDIAFEQWIRGEKVAEMTTTDLSYEMMNPRNDSPYGLSPIESLLITLDSQMRAMLYNLNYLSDNNIPQGFLGMPEGWTPDQIKEYKEFFDAWVGSSKAQAKVYPIPAGTTYQATSKPGDFSFQQMFDYLDRKIAMLFDITPQELGLSLQQYKENAEGQDRIQNRKGIKPLANFLQEIFTDLLQQELGFKKFAFKFTGLDGKYTPDQLKMLIPIGVLGLDEARNDMGLKKLGVENFVITAGGITPVSQIGISATVSGTGEDDTQLTVPDAKAPNNKNTEQDISGVGVENNKDQKMVKRGKNLSFEILTGKTKFKKFRKTVKRALLDAIEPYTTADGIAQVTETKKADNPSNFDISVNIPGLKDYLNWAFGAGADNAAATLKISGSPFKEKSKAFSDMIATRENYLIDSVNETTKDWIVNQISNGKTNSLTNAEIAQKISDDAPEISAARADTIVNTEVANAMQQAELGVYKDQGIEEKKWITSEDDLVDPICADMDGEIVKVDETFSSGDTAPPAHPNAVLAGSTFSSYGELQEMVRGDYEGDAVLIRTTGGHDLTIGMNHPILTQRGMVKACELTESDYLIYDNRLNNMTSNINFNQIPMVEDVFQTLLSAGAQSIIATPAHDLHGDRKFCKGEIQVIKPANSLLNIIDSGSIEQFREMGFMETDMKTVLLSGDSSSSFGLDRINLSSSGNMSRSLTSYEFVHIQSIRYIIFKGEAFDATTQTGLYNSNGFVVSNCRCYMNGVTEDISQMEDSEDIKKDWVTINGAHVFFNDGGGSSGGSSSSIPTTTTRDTSKPGSQTHAILQSYSQGNSITPQQIDQVMLHPVIAQAYNQFIKENPSSGKLFTEALNQGNIHGVLDILGSKISQIDPTFGHFVSEMNQAHDVNSINHTIL